MADDPKTVKKTIYNTGDGPRSIFDSDGLNHIIRPGDSAELTVSQAELDDLTPGLTTTKPKAAAEGATGPTPEELAATDQARAISDAALVLTKANSRDQLLDIAKAEDVTVETDDNKDQIALKIAQKRAGVKA